MPALYIPRLRDKLRLTADWSFSVFVEHRNQSLLDHMGYGYGSKKLEALQKEYHYLYRGDVELGEKFTIPAGTVLSVERIFIRNGAADFDSVTFRAKLEGKSLRFWMKLTDANGLQFEPD